MHTVTVTNQAAPAVGGGRTRTRTRNHHMEIRREGVRPGDWLYMWACVHCGRTLTQLDAEAAPDDPTTPAARVCKAA